MPSAYREAFSFGENNIVLFRKSNIAGNDPTTQLIIFMNLSRTIPCSFIKFQI
jgi:hypothetical protein